jgi:HK97 family phage prohead protease
MLVQKTLKFDAVSLKMEGETGKFSGYASVFGGVDSYGDTIKKGAFLDAIEKSMPKMFFNHSWDMPIGKWTKATEDEHGLFVEGELTPDLDLSKNVRAAMKHGTLDGLSIGGFLKKGDYEETKDGRLIHKWTELTEVSPVVFPADKSARINLSSVKGIDFEALLPECKTERDIEKLLRDAGLGKWEAMAIVSRAKAILVGRDASENDEAKTQALILERLSKMATS